MDSIFNSFNVLKIIVLFEIFENLPNVKIGNKKASRYNFWVSLALLLFSHDGQSWNGAGIYFLYISATTKTIPKLVKFENYFDLFSQEKGIDVHP